MLKSRLPVAPSRLCASCLRHSSAIIRSNIERTTHRRSKETTESRTTLYSKQT